MAATVDGKIADFQRNAARFGSDRDKHHLAQQVALADAVLFGAGTLRAYGTSLPLRDRAAIAERASRQQSPQPVHIVFSRSGAIDPSYPFFRQPIPRWLVTTPAGAKSWTVDRDRGFERILMAEVGRSGDFDWPPILKQLRSLGVRRGAVLGGGQLVASLLVENAIADLWLTICPLILGGETAPTPVEGEGFLESQARRLELLEVRREGQELFLHYRVRASKD